MKSKDFRRMSACAIADAVRQREVTARAIVGAALDNIAATEPEVNAFIHVDAAAAIEAANRVDLAIAAGKDPGPLAGVPVSVKDLVHVAGMPTSSGSAVFAGTIAAEDATPIARLRTAGAIIVGKTTTPEFGHKPLTESPLFGRTLNPWNRRYTAGGSSGGAAASLAARQVPLAVGTDGGGSIRIPASVCGVFGLKATLGVIPHVHSVDLFGNNSYIGPMARNLDDLVRMFEVMAGPEDRDPWSRRGVSTGNVVPSSTGLRVGIALTVGNAVVEPDVAQAFESAVSAIEAAGFVTRRVEIDLARYEPGFRIHLESLLAGRFAARVARDRARFDPSFVATVENGLRHRAVDLVGANGLRTDLYREIENLFEDIDLFVTPTVAAASLPADTDPHAPVRIAGVDCGPIRAGWYPYTFPFNLCGHPALSMPCGWSSDGVPIGLQVVAGWDEERSILQFARTLVGALSIEERWVGTE